MSSFFVAGTDTDVGKTTACRAIIQALQAKGVRIVGYKPIACSCEEGVSILSKINLMNPKQIMVLKIIQMC